MADDPMNSEVTGGSDAPSDASGDATRPDPFVRDSIEWPVGSTLLRQLAVVVGVMVIWGGTFRVAMNLPTETAADVAAAERRAERRRGAEVAGTASESAMTADGGAASSGDAAGPVANSDTSPAGGSASTSNGSAASDAPARVSAEVAAAAPTSSPPPSLTPTATTTTSPQTPTASTQTSVTPTQTAPAADDPIAAMDNDDDFLSQLPGLTDLPTVSFASDVMPIIERRCVKCHGGARDDGSLRIEEGLDMRTLEGILAGSTWGSVVEPGDPVASYMLEMVLKGDMPEDGPRLLPGEVRILTAWIYSGAGGN